MCINYIFYYYYDSAWCVVPASQLNKTELSQDFYQLHMM